MPLLCKEGRGEVEATLQIVGIRLRLTLPAMSVFFHFKIK